MTSTSQTEHDRSFITAMSVPIEDDLGMIPGTACECGPHDTLHGAEECFSRRRVAITGGAPGHDAIGLNIFYADGVDLDDADSEALMWNSSYEPDHCPHVRRSDGRCRWCGTVEVSGPPAALNPA